MSDQVYTPRSQLDTFALSLLAAKLPDVGKNNPRMRFKLHLHKINIGYSQVGVIVTTGENTGDKPRPIELKMPKWVLVAALEQLKEYAKQPFSTTKEAIGWEIQGPKMVNGKITAERIKAGTLVVGRNDKGPFMSLVHWNDKVPKIAFYPGLNQERDVINPAKDDPERSYKLVAMATLGFASEVLSVINHEWNEGQSRTIRNTVKDLPQSNGYNPNDDVSVSEVVPEDLPF